MGQLGARADREAVTVLDRETRVAARVDHARRPRHRGRLDPADATVAGGNPGCGDVVTVFLRVEPAADRILAMSFEGTGCTLSQAAASIVADRVNREPVSFDAVESWSDRALVEQLGRDLVGSRHRCATLTLGILKRAVRLLRTERRLRAAGHSEADVRRLIAAVANRG